ncbi:hypothetical protein IH981_02105 [Patescibacteria group bacterium]|nr:hypothetical protein [Patescibacteria group bacterium]
MSEHDHQLIADVGYIKGKVESIEDHMIRQNGAIVELKKKVAKHDVILGKFGAMISVIAFIVAAFFNIVIEWVKKAFTN